MSHYTTFGHIEEFNSDLESFAAYRERVQCFFLANNIEEERQVAVLLSVLGTKTHSLLRDLLAPELPTSKTVEQLFDILQKHVEPEKIIIAERFKFHKRTQGKDESVAQFVADLKRLASTCDFKNNLDDSLRDRFVCGIQSTATQRKLLSMKELTFQTAVETAISCEVIEKHMDDMRLPSESVEVHRTNSKFIGLI
jgi:hypothetical protein